MQWFIAYGWTRGIPERIALVGLVLMFTGVGLILAGYITRIVIEFGR